MVKAAFEVVALVDLPTGIEQVVHDDEVDLAVLAVLCHPKLLILGVS